MNHLLLHCIIFLLLGTFCKTKPALSPEEVVQKWQRHIDKNQFELARQLSTQQAKSYVDFLDALTDGDTSEIYQTVLIELKCDVQGEIAICRYLTEDEIGEKIPGTLVLKKIKGQWLVDSVEDFEPELLDSLRQGDENILFPSDSLDEELE